jgi:hypothetical protein
VPRLWLLKTYAPEFLAQPKTLGYAFEVILAWTSGKPLPLISLGFFGAGGPDLLSQAFALIGMMSALAEWLPEDLSQVNFAAFAELYRQLVEIARQAEEYRRGGNFDEPGLSDRLDDIVFRCRLDPFEALAEEYKRRVREAKQAQFLGHFLQKHPGIQHKAGVPLGGTFILVYHELPKPPPRGPETGPRRIPRAALEFDEDKIELLDNAFARLPYKAQLAEDPDLQLIYKIVTGNLLVPKIARPKVARHVYLDAVARLADGTVIADFFLPYACCSNCPPIQYQLPPARIRVSPHAGCTNVDGFAEVTLTTEGAAGAVSVSVDGGVFQESTGGLLLGAGQHSVVVRDAAGNQSPPVAISVPPALQLGTPQVVVDQAAGTWQVVFTVTGGTPPYAADVGTVVEATYTSPALPVADVLQVVIKDTAGCTAEGAFESGVMPCELPCEGKAVRGGYRFWIPEARPGLPINEYAVDVHQFRLIAPNGTDVDLTGQVAAAISTPTTIAATDFPDVTQRWVKRINKLISGAVGSDQWLSFDYESATEPATTGTLWIDRITCIEFAFELAVKFVQGKRGHHFELAYTRDGTVVIEPGAHSSGQIPPFGGSTSNKCRPTEPPVPLCEGTDLKLEIKRDGVIPDAVTLTAVPTGQDQPAALLWEIQDGIPSIAGDQQVVLNFNPTEPVEKLVRLTAITDKGCTVTLDRKINIANLEG